MDPADRLREARKQMRIVADELDEGHAEDYLRNSMTDLEVIIDMLDGRMEANAS